MHHTWVGEGDGFHAQIDQEDWQSLYIVNHVGFAARLNLKTRERSYITPNPETILNMSDYFQPDFPDSMTNYTIYPGEHWFFQGMSPLRPKLPSQFRFNWSSPLILSRHNSSTIYFGGNHLFKSVDRGENWRIISPDLTINDPARRSPTLSGGLTRSVTGGENHFTIVTISESPLNPDILWVGTDDGQVQMTKDGGKNWLNVKKNIPNLPSEIWVSRVEASAHKPGRCYITLDNHRYDDMKSYVFVTEDYGQTWTDISSDISDLWSTYVIREDPINENLLFVGTETTVYTSYDRGKNWLELMAKIPQVAFHDLTIHPRDGDLIAGTHGRSIWILDDISALRQLNTKVIDKPLYVFKSKTATKWKTVITGRKQPFFEFRGENPTPGAMIQFYLKKAVSDSVEITIKDPFSNLISKWKTDAKTGINRKYWNFKFPITETGLRVYRDELQATIEKLKNRVEKPVLIKTLKKISHAIKNSQSIHKLDSLRTKLVTDFSGYAKGERIFPKRVKTITAMAGKYEVIIKHNESESSNWIEVREDPILSSEEN
jgi:hypothetical protein